MWLESEHHYRRMAGSKDDDLARQHLRHFHGRLGHRNHQGHERAGHRVGHGDEKRYQSPVRRWHDHGHVDERRETWWVTVLDDICERWELAVM
jgi:hypothetical protein